jgi:tRNA-splicing ligase RtcB
MINLTGLSSHKKQFQNPEMKVPVVFHASDDLLPDEETFGKLENLAKDPRMFHHIAAMSDVHSKKGRKVPTGTVAASQNFLFPQINDTAPNCGMRFLKTGLDEKNITQEKIDELFKELVKTVPTKKYFGEKIPYSLALEICKHGTAPVAEYLKTKTKNEIENTYREGNSFGDENITSREIFDVIPKLFLKIGSKRLGILGAAGNHFLDLMKITEIKDSAVAQKFGIYPGQYVFLVHTGSGLMGQYVSYMFTPKIKEHRSQKFMLELGKLTFDSQLKKVYEHLQQKVKSYQDKEEFFGYEDHSLEGRMFWRAYRAAANFGFANRTIITHNIEKSMKKILGPGAGMDLLYDTPHISIEREKHFNEDVWVHRNGSVRANGTEKMKDHPLFGLTGEPIFIPSSMTTPAYIGVGTDENESAFFSAPHGTGRRKESEDDIPKDKKELFKKVASRNVKLYNAASKGVVLQDSAYYKDVEEVISGMTDNKMIKVVAKMEPVAVLMY